MPHSTLAKKNSGMKFFIVMGLLCSLFILAPSLRAASLSGEQVTLTVTVTGADSTNTPYNINLYTGSFTVGAGVEVSNQAVSGSIPNPGFPALPFSGTITVDVSGNAMSVNYTGTQPIGDLNYILSSVTDQSASSVISAAETSESGFTLGINQTLPPTFDNSGNGWITATLFCSGIQPGVNLNQAISFALAGAVAAPDLTVGLSHSGNFKQGQTGAQYTVAVNNISGSASSGTITAKITTLPAGLTATAFTGTGWTQASLSLPRRRSAEA